MSETEMRSRPDGWPEPRERASAGSHDRGDGAPHDGDRRSWSRPFEIRPARPEELARIGEITVEAYLRDGFLDGTEASYADKLRDTRARSRTAELLAAVDASGAVLGSVTVVRPGTDWAEISRGGELEFRMLAVDPAARGRGVGEALTRAVVERARELGSTRVVLSSLDTMTTAHRLYERLGFTRLPERDWRPEPHVRLIAYALETPPR